MDDNVDLFSGCVAIIFKIAFTVLVLVWGYKALGYLETIARDTQMIEARTRSCACN